MSGFVLDASSALAWCFVDEGSKADDALIEHLAVSGALVPAIWPLEVANALVVAERRGRIAPEEGNTFISLIEQMPIAVDPHTGSHAFDKTIALAREHGLSCYDAAYLELALRAGLPLATNDDRLALAAKRAGCPDW